MPEERSGAKLPRLEQPVHYTGSMSQTHRFQGTVYNHFVVAVLIAGQYSSRVFWEYRISTLLI